MKNEVKDWKRKRERKQSLSEGEKHKDSIEAKDAVE